MNDLCRSGVDPTASKKILALSRVITGLAIISNQQVHTAWGSP